MARFVVRFVTDWDPTRALTYIADFENAQQWDPSVARSTRHDDGPLQVGSTFDLAVRFAGRTVPLRYELTELSDTRAVLRAATSSFESCDTVSVALNGERTELTYDAQLSLRGWWRVFNPLLAIAFARLAERAAVGIRRAIA
ncbi:MAG: SRPBCC family protein [Acidimicrobiales bacterium]